MSLTANYIISLVVETVKILLMGCGIFGFRLNLRFRGFLIAGLFIVIITIVAGNEYMSLASFLYGNMAAVISINLCEGKNKAFYCILSSVFVSLLDMIIASYIFFFNLANVETVRENYLKNIGINAISFIVLLAVTVIKRFLFRDFSKRFGYLRKRYIALFTLAGFIAALYLTPVINYNFSEKTNNILSLFLCSGATLLYIIFLSFVNSSFKTALYGKAIERLEAFITEQKRYYEISLEKAYNRRRLYHDIMFHIKSMYALLRGNKYDDLQSYFESVTECYNETMLDCDTGNHIVNAVIQDCKRRYPKINMIVSGLLPNELKIPDMDICTIFSNLIENACYAANNSQEDKYVGIDIKIINSSVLINIENEYNPDVPRGSGIGSINVQECVMKNFGEVKYSRKNSWFKVGVILPNAIKMTE